MRKFTYSLIFSVTIFLSGNAQIPGNRLNDYWASSYAIGDIEAMEEIAVFSLDHAIKTGNKDSIGLAWYKIGWVAEKQKDYSKCLNAYRLSYNHYLEANNLHQASLLGLNRGIVLFELGLFKESIEQLNIAESTSDTSSFHYYKFPEYFALNYLNLGSVDESLSFFNKALSYSPTNDSQLLIKNNIGRAYFLNGNTRKAIDIWNECLNSPNSLDELEIGRIFNNLGQAYNSLSEYKNADSCFIQAKRLMGYSIPTPYYNQAVLYENLGHNALAIETILEFISNCSVDYGKSNMVNELSFLISKGENLSKKLGRQQDFEIYSDARSKIYSQGTVGIEVANKEREIAEFLLDENSALLNHTLSLERKVKFTIYVILGMSLIILTCAFFYVWNKRKRLKTNISKIAQSRFQ